MKALLERFKANGWMIATAVVAVCIVGSGLKLVEAGDETRQLYSDLGRVQAEQDALLAEHSRLLLERGALTSLSNIEQVAVEDLDMHFPETVAQVVE